MLSTNIPKVTGEPLVTGVTAAPDKLSEVYQQHYRETYVELAIEAQKILGFDVLETFEELFKLGCNQPELSSLIDQAVASNPLLMNWPMQDSDCIGLISQGPYVQAQINYHGVSIHDVMRYVCDLFRDLPESVSGSDQAAA